MVVVWELGVLLCMAGGQQSQLCFVLFRVHLKTLSLTHMHTLTCCGWMQRSESCSNLWLRER